MIDVIHVHVHVNLAVHTDLYIRFEGPGPCINKQNLVHVQLYLLGKGEYTRPARPPHKLY